MLSWSRQLYVVAGSVVTLGCATSGGDAASGAGMKMAAVSCTTQIENELKQCEQKCPTATGNEHFSVQHKIAMENTACKESCAEALEERSAQCKTGR